MSVPIVEVRAARATRDDGMQFARYLDQAAEGFFRLMLGRRSAEILAQAFQSPGHDLSFQRAIFAERERQVVGMACSFSAEQHRLSNDRPLREAPGFPRLRAGLVAILSARVRRALDRMDDRDFYLLAIAVDAECRGQGIGSILIDAVEERGRESGAERLCLDVFSLNQGGRRLYERLGMQVVSATPAFLFFKRWQLLRMAKLL